MGILSKVKAWLILFRAHTVILEAPIAALGAALGVGTFWSVEVALWATFGIIYHFTGYGMNSYVDWKKGYDKDDPNKEHHPLNTGEINPDIASKVIKVMFVVLLGYAIILSNFRPASLIALAVMISSGVLYNYVGKEIEHKYILVALVHTSVFVVPYLSYSSDTGMIIWFGAGAYFVHHIFQILISGDVKDIKQDESGVIKDMGMSIDITEKGEELLDVSPNVVAISYIISFIEVMIVVAVILFFETELVQVVLTLGMAGWMIIEIDEIIGEGLYQRTRRVNAMSRKELAGLWMIFASFTAKLGVAAWLAMVVISIAYFVPVSQFMWGGLTPDV